MHTVWPSQAWQEAMPRIKCEEVWEIDLEDNQFPSHLLPKKRFFHFFHSQFYFGLRWRKRCSEMQNPGIVNHPPLRQSDLFGDPCLWCRPGVGPRLRWGRILPGRLQLLERRVILKNELVLKVLTPPPDFEA